MIIQNRKFMTEKSKNSFYIAGIGSSAGGLEALQDLLSHLPENLNNIAFIVAQHLSPTHKSMLVQLLSRETKLSVLEAKNGTTIVANAAYITPPDTEITVSAGKIWLQKPKLGVGPKPSVDILFHSLALEYKENAIGIILSGTGSDGAIGVKYIKNSLGVVIVQEPHTAKYNGMPLAAIETGIVDLVLAPDKIGEELFEITQNESHNRIFKSATIEEDSNSLGKIFQLLSKRTRTDFSNYKPSTISRRLEKRLSFLKIDSIDKYLTYVEKDPDELDSLFNMILIGVTSFFRDAAAFQEIEKILLKIINSKAEGEPIRIWTPGCATGEEPYSLAILLFKNLKEKISDYNIQIFATDIDERAISFARKGIYSQDSLKEISPDLVNQFFLKKGNNFELLKSVRSLVLFSKHDLTSNPPFLKLDLISCRNLLIYFGSSLQKQIIPIFHYALKPNGYLFQGKSETVGQYSDLFSTIDGKSKIFQRKRGSKIHTVQFSAFRPASKNYPIPNVPKQKGEPLLPDVIKETIFNTFEFPYLIVNDGLDIQEISGDVRLYLGISEGVMNSNVFKLIHKDLLLELRYVLTKAIKDRIQQKSNIVKFNFFGNFHFVRMKIKPLLFSENTKDLFLVIFEKYDPEEFLPIATFPDKENHPINLDNNRITELEHELETTKEHLQTYIEELETTNEELQSLNEEMQSTNEELQSSNEELETSNEELQSTNEEIQIAYTELKAANEELEEKDSLLINTEANAKALLNNTLQSFILLDKSYLVISFNTKASETLYNTSGKVLEIRKSIFDYIATENLELFRNGLSEALGGNAVSGEYRVTNVDKSISWYLYNLTPAIKHESSIEAVSLSFLDITSIRTLQTELSISEKLIASVFESNNNGICITDKNGFFVNLNRGYCEIYGYTKNELIGKHFTTVVPDSYKKILSDLHDKFIQGEEELAAEWTVQRKDGSLIDVFASASLLTQADGTRYKITSIRDITENKKYKNLLEETQESASVGGWQYDTITQEVSWTEETFKVFGLDHEKFTLNLNTMSNLFTDEAKLIFQNSIHQTLHFGKAFDLELQPIQTNPNIVWIRATCKPVLVYDKVVKLFGTFQNITSIKESSQRLKESEDLFRSLYENINDSIFITNSRGIIIKVNSAATKIFGYSESEFYDINIKSLIHQESQSAFMNSRISSVFTGELNSIRKNNEIFPTEIYSSIFQLSSGQERIFTIIRDLSEKKQKELEREKILSNLAQRNRDLEQFSYIISHNLRSPLANILGLTNLLEENSSETDRNNLIIRNLHRASENLDNIIKDLSEILQVRKQVQEEKQSLKFSELVESIKVSIENLITEKFVTIETDFSQIDEIKTLKSYSYSIFYNLILNSIHYSQKEKTPMIQIRSNKLLNKIEIVFKDNGIGIDLEKYGNQIFGLYKRFHFDIEGKGIGLYIIKTQIELLGGSIRIESNVGEGTTFIIEIPYYE